MPRTREGEKEREKKKREREREDSLSCNALQPAGSITQKTPKKPKSFSFHQRTSTGMILLTSDISIAFILPFTGCLSGSFACTDALSFFCWFQNFLRKRKRKRNAEISQVLSKRRKMNCGPILQTTDFYEERQREISSFRSVQLTWIFILNVRKR